MTNQPTPNPKRDTFTITPQPPSTPPKGFDGGYWQAPQRFPVVLFLIGVTFFIMACLIIGGVGYLALQDEATPKPTQNIVAEDLTATPIIVGGVTDFAPIIASPTHTAAPTATEFELATNTPIEELILTATFTFIPPTQLPPTNTATSTRTPTITPSLPATITPSVTASPTLTLTASATFTPSLTPLYSDTPTNTVPPPTITPDTGGHLVRLFYDDWSFYAWNGSTQQLAISNFVFEAIDTDGNFAGYRLEGGLWAQFYAYLEAGKCVAMEVTTAPSWLRPTQCWVYNAVLTPQSHYTTIFWFDRPNMAGFRVMWQDVEIGQCETGVGECNIYVPR